MNRQCGLMAVAFAIHVTLFSGAVCAQSESDDRERLAAIRLLESLDTDGDGNIQPGEITKRVRFSLERIAKIGDMQLDVTYSVGRWKQAWQQYQAALIPGKPGDGEIRNFAIPPQKPLVPGFGTSEIRYAYTPEDLANAAAVIARYDGDGDGGIDNKEAKLHGFEQDVFDYDFNDDQRVNKLEFAQRYAHQRLRQSRSASVRYAVPAPPKRAPARLSSTIRRTSSATESNRESRALADAVLDRHDRNRDRRLDQTERSGLGIDMGQVDLDRDGLLVESEIELWLFRNMKEENEDLSGTLPSWFFDRDANGDGQVEMQEYASEWTDELIAEFKSYDVDLDGILTSQELLQSNFIVGHSYVNAKAEMLAPHSTLLSEIEVQEDFVIGDLNVQLSITHSYTEQLDAYLVGPDGQRIELFTAVGKSDNHFDNTILDDEAPAPIIKSHAPFRGSFQPEALSKGQPSLSHYKGKNLKGVWQLIVRAQRSDRFGVLHRWLLAVKPVDEFER